MSIPVLVQVSDEVRRLSIAGSSVAPGDFRLKKLISPLEQSGQKAPVFAKVAQAATAVINSNEKSSPEALLELSTLVNAVLYTQGETGLAGQLEPIKTIDLGQQQTQTAARVLKPLLDALSESGSGRLELIRDAFERGRFRDLRLVTPALKGLDDPYPEIADFIADHILPLYGTAILGGLRDQFDIKGRAGHVRRLRLMHRLDSEGTRETVRRALDEGSKEVKIAAIECLGDSPDDLSFLLEQSKAKAKDVRLAALKALSRSNADEAVKVLCAIIKDVESETIIEPVRASRNSQVLEFLLKQTRQQFATILADKSKDKAKTSKLVGRLLVLLECLRERDDRGTEQLLLGLFGQREKFSAIKGEPGGTDVEQRLVSIMATSGQQTKRALVDVHATLPADQLTVAFVVARQICEPAEVFAMFSGYLATSANEKKQSATAHKREAIVLDLTRTWGWRTHAVFSHETDDRRAKLDPRWLDLAADLKHPELVLALARPGHTRTTELLSQWLTERLKKSKDPYELGQFLHTMVRIQHPGATDGVVEALKKHASGAHSYGLYWAAQIIPELPQDAIPKLEALLPTLPEKVIDHLVGAVTQLKNRVADSGSTR